MSGMKPQQIKATRYQEYQKALRDLRSQEGSAQKAALYLRYDTECWADARELVRHALRFSGTARSLYSDVVECWEKPGCQAIALEALRQRPATQRWADECMRAYKYDDAIPSPPSEWEAALEKGSGDPDFAHLTDCIYRFIHHAFNRQIDIENGELKVQPENAPEFVGWLYVQSLMDHVGITSAALDRWPKVRHEGTGQVDDLQSIMAGHLKAPPTRHERKLKHDIVSGLKGQHSHLRHVAKHTDRTLHWYKCRVDPGTVELYLQELGEEGKYPDRANIVNCIADIDTLTGWPRRWRD